MPRSLEDIPIIDTHEHFSFVYKWRPEVVGILHVFLDSHYLMADIAASDPGNAGHEWQEEGITPFHALVKAQGIVSAAEEKAAMEFIIDRLAKVALTSDWKAFHITLRDLYGLREPLVTRKNWKALDARVRKAYKDRTKWYLEVLRRAGIRLAFWCYGRPELAGPCRGVLSVGAFARKAKGDVKDSGGLKAEFAKYVAAAVMGYNPVSMKLVFNDSRNITTAKPDLREVDGALAALRPDSNLADSAVVNDYVHQLAAEVSAQKNMPLQVHTGLSAGNEYDGPTAEFYALKIEPFIARNPGARFDIFHGSFPQWGEAVVLARKYPNVYLNMCWVPTLSESMAEAMLDAALDAVPVNKIMWGGDAHSPEMGYGIAVLFRRILARVLKKRALRPMLARETAEWILWRSAAELYDVSI